MAKIHIGSQKIERTLLFPLLSFLGGELSWWFCLHQLKASSRKNALNMIHESQRIISKKNSSSESSNSSDKTHQNIGDR